MVVIPGAEKDGAVIEFRRSWATGQMLEHLGHTCLH